VCLLAATMAVIHEKLLAEAAMTDQQRTWTVGESFTYLALKATTLQQYKVVAHEPTAANQSNTTYRKSDLVLHLDGMGTSYVYWK
jgi:UDP-N-acetylmuramyl pentapeptide synthase